MKKIIVLLAVIFSLSLVSCEDVESTFNESNNDQNKSTSSASIDELVAPENSYLFGINVSNQPYIVIREMIRNKNEELMESSFIINGKENIYTVNYADIDYALDEDQICKKISEKSTDYLSYTYDEQKLTDILNSIAKSENKPAVNAAARRENGQIVISDAKNGYVIDTDKSRDELSKILALEENEVTISFIDSTAQYTRNDFNDFTVIGSYDTKYNIYDTSRNKNLATASSKINNVTLYPGEVFSTNAHYGETTVENGYAVSHVIVDNELVDGVGGGVCQISTTLYNAVIRAELEVVERRNHSIPVGYAPLGFDATLANPYIDFKFKNNYDAPILITAWIDNGTASVRIYGQETHDSGRTLKFRSELVSEDPAVVNTVEDDTLKTGEKVVEVTPIDGKVVNTYKDVYENGKLVDTVFLSKSNYARRDGVTKVGNGTNVAKPSENEDTGSSSNSNNNTNSNNVGTGTSTNTEKDDSQTVENGGEDSSTSTETTTGDTSGESGSLGLSNSYGQGGGLGLIQ